MIRTVALIVALGSTFATAQSQDVAKPPAHSVGVSATAKRSAASTKLTPQRQFVLDTIQSALALQESDPQDRLRVLAASSELAAPISPKLAKQLGDEGSQLELRIIDSGSVPAVSILSTGKVSCAAASEFVNNVSPEFVARAEQSLVGAITKCPKTTLDRARSLLEEAMQQNVLAPQALLAAANASGAKSNWSQQEFEKLFGSLPKDSIQSNRQAPTIAQFYDTMAPNVDKDVATKAGVKFLDWLATLDDSGSRNMAINVVTSAMQRAIGPEKYAEALRSDMTAHSIAMLAGHSAQLETPDQDDTALTMATSKRGADRAEELRAMPPAKRARAAAADGFAAGRKDREEANRYFDIAYTALNEMWTDRGSNPKSVAVVQEVNEAAAQIDPVSALQRAEKLEDSSAQAIGMLAVARVAASSGGH